MNKQKNPAKVALLVAVPTLALLLLLSLVVIFSLWRWGTTQRQHARAVQEQLLAAQSQVRIQDSQATMMKAMLGLGGVTEAEMDALKQGASGDGDIDAISASFARDMALFGPDVEITNRNYPNLAVYLNTAIRDRESAYIAAREALIAARSESESDVKSRPPEEPSDESK